MVTLPRLLARRFRAVLRRCQVQRNRLEPFVVLRSDTESDSLEAVCGEGAIRLGQPLRYLTSVLAFSASVLAAVESKVNEPVTLEDLGQGRGLACWSDVGEEQRHEFALVAPDAHLSFPAPPHPLTNPGPGFVLALRQACETASRHETGRSLHKILLRGKDGRLVATDGRQLLMQGGFSFPWPGDLLVPQTGAWSCRELAGEQPVGIGHAEAHVFVSAGPWMLALAKDRGGRYPDVASVIPAQSAVTTSLTLGPESMALLQKELPRWPEDRANPVGVVVEPGAGIVVRGESGAAEPAATLSLPDAHVDGKPTAVRVDARHLLRALKLGFRQLEITRPDRPLCCRDGTRTFVWMPLADPAPASKPALAAQAHHEPERTPMPEPRTNGKHPPPDDPLAPSDPLAEAEAVKALLAEAQNRLGRLVTTLRQHRRQARAVAAAVQSLRQLPPLAP